MRNFKFRVWYPGKKEMIYFGQKWEEIDHPGWFLQLEEKNLAFATSKEFSKNHKQLPWSGEDGLKLMQYIGIDDRNGDPIYERDIVKLELLDMIGKVAYSESYAAFGVKKPGWEESRWWDFSNAYEGRTPDGEKTIEILGNEYENPELSCRPLE